MHVTIRKPSTPGEILQHEFMQPYSLTQDGLAKLLGIARRRINEIVRGKRSITPDTALRLAKLFNTTAEFWLNLQLKLDLWQASNQVTIRNDLKKIRTLVATKVG